MDQLESICNFMHFDNKVIILLIEICHNFFKDISPKEFPTDRKASLPKRCIAWNSKRKETVFWCPDC